MREKYEKEKEVGKRFEMMRESLRLSQTQIAERLGITQSTISLIERGKQLPSKPILKVLSYEFSVKGSWLLDGEGSLVIGSKLVGGAPAADQESSADHDPRLGVLRAIDAAIDAFNRQRSASRQAGHEVMDFRKGYGKEVSQKYTWISQVKNIMENGREEDKQKLRQLIVEAADNMLDDKSKDCEELKRQKDADLP